MTSASLLLPLTVIGLLLTANAAYGQVGGSRDEQVITGSRVALPRQQIGSAVTVLDRQFLQDLQLPYTADALRHVPGLAVSRAGGFGGLTQLHLRGAEGNHVLVLVDGVEISPAGTGEVDLSSLLTAELERVEVIRGPQSGVYGSNAMAGVVHIITRGNGASGLSGAFEGGSFGTWQASGSGRYAGERGFLSFNGAYRDSKGISISPTGTEKDGDETLSVSAKGRLILSDTLRLDANMRYADKSADGDDQDFSGGPMQGLIIDSGSYIKTEDVSGSVTGTLSLLEGDWVSTASLAYSDNEVLGFSGGDYGSDSARRTLGATSTYRFNAGEMAHRLVGFIEQERETYRNTVPFDASQVPRLERNLLGFGAEYHLNLTEGLYLSGVVRHDDNDAFEDATTYRLSAAYVLESTGTRLHASHGTGVTNPTFTEQFGFIPGEFVGNPALTPEKAGSWDVGIEHPVVRDALIVDVTYFEARLKDEISAAFDPVAMASTVRNAAGKSRRRGVELSLTATPAAGLRITGSYSYVDSTDPDGTREVRRPRHMGSLDISYSFPGDRLTLYIGGVYNGKQLDNDYRNYFTNGFLVEKTALAAYTVVNASARYRASDWAEIFGRIENLTDERYQEVLGYATPGIAGFVGVRLRYNVSR